MATAGRIPVDLESDDDLSESMTKLKISKKKKKVRSGDRLYGFFRCDKCKKNWESSQVYVKYVEGGEIEFWKQQCKRCKQYNEPYHTEPIKCSYCGEEDCICSEEEKRERHVDKTKHHEEDLCEKCKSGDPCV